MCLSYHTPRSAGLLILALLVCPVWASAADAAGVVGFRNDTNQVISVQTTLELPNGVVKRGKPQMLYPGEVAIDGLIGMGVRRITVSDPKKPTASPLFDDKKMLADDTFYSVQLETVINVKNPPPMKLKLVVVVLPGSAKKPGTNPTMPPKPPTGQPKKP
jgi:hypothetical protein